MDAWLNKHSSRSATKQSRGTKRRRSSSPIDSSNSINDHNSNNNNNNNNNDDSSNPPASKKSKTSITTSNINSKTPKATKSSKYVPKQTKSHHFGKLQMNYPNIKKYFEFLPKTETIRCKPCQVFIML